MEIPGDNCYFEVKPARSEAMRGMFDHGYLNYSLGKPQILNLRDDCQKEQPGAFSLPGELLFTPD